MWGSRRNRDGAQVTCIACGDSVARSDAREYDKHGDRWNREDKEFEFLCKRCYRDLCHQPRAGLEALLVESRAGHRDRDAFVAALCDRLAEREDSPES
ncbi:DUF7562 family protein [Halorientalis halophila]|jgi:hypothetical protein|uniref:DUF7562 family protein n=1 Tax=Halorientalis halophila TaxID=3108499 RepID=UPI003009270B